MKYRLLIVAATVAWGSSFVMVKDLTDAVSPAWLMALRFSAAAAMMMAATFPRRSLWFRRDYVGWGIGLGVSMFLAYYLQTVGITDTTPGKNAFLTATYCVMVPFICWAAFKARPTAANILAAVVCLFGIGLIALDGDGLSLRFGDALTLGAAVFFAVQIVMVGRCSAGRDVYVLTAWMFAVMAVCSVAVGALAEPAPDLAALTGAQWAQFAYLAAIVSCAALLAQNVALKHVPASTGALLLSLESVFGVLFSVLLGAETLSVRIVAGFVAVFCSIVISELGTAGLASRHRTRG